MTLRKLDLLWKTKCQFKYGNKESHDKNDIDNNKKTFIDETNEMDFWNL